MVIKIEILEMVPVKGVICEEPRARIVNISQYPVSTLSVSHSVNDSMNRQNHQAQLRLDIFSVKYSHYLSSVEIQEHRYYSFNNRLEHVLTFMTEIYFKREV